MGIALTIPESLLKFFFTSAVGMEGQIFWPELPLLRVVTLKMFFIQVWKYTYIHAHIAFDNRYDALKNREKNYQVLDYIQ